MYGGASQLNNAMFEMLIESERLLHYVVLLFCFIGVTTHLSCRNLSFRSRQKLLFLTGSACTAYLSSSSSSSTLLVMVGICVGLAFLTPSSEHESFPSQPALPGRSLLPLIVLTTTTFLALSHNLDSFSPHLLTWEGPVVEGFGEAFSNQVTVSQFALGSLVWQEGVLSAGHSSFGYGAPTYAILNWFGFNQFNLRIASVILASFSVVVIFELVQRYYGALAGLATAIVLVTSEMYAFYARYGSSTSASLFFSLISIRLTCAVWEHSRSRFILPVCTVAILFLTTLNYAPARLLVLVLVTILFTGIACQARSQYGVIRLIVFSTAIFAVVLIQWKYDATQRFLHARGEQIFSMAGSTEWVEEVLGERAASEPQRDSLTFGEWTALATNLISSQTGKQLVDLAAPIRSGIKAQCKLHLDPPPLKLFMWALFPFVLWGLVHTVRRPSLIGSTLALWTAFSCVTVLLTNRVDAHRTFLLIVPISCWIGIGIAQLLPALFPITTNGRVLTHSALAALAGLLLFCAWERVNCFRGGPDPVVTSLNERVASLDTDVVLAARFDHKKFDTVYLAMLERNRLHPLRRGSLISPRLREELRNGQIERYPAAFRKVLSLLDARTTLLLAPTEEYSETGNRLQELGYVVEEYGMDNFSFLVVKPSQHIKHSVERIDTPQIRFPTEEGWTSIEAHLLPDSVHFNYAPPRSNRTWNGLPLRIYGRFYSTGYGCHASSRFSLPVPGSAQFFSAVVGLTSDSSCASASAIVTVTDDTNTTLTHSPLLDHSRTNAAHLITSVQSTSAIEIRIEDANDGIDCDHVGLADLKFWLKERPR